MSETPPNPPCPRVLWADVQGPRGKPSAKGRVLFPHEYLLHGSRSYFIKQRSFPQTLYCVYYFIDYNLYFQSLSFSLFSFSSQPTPPLAGVGGRLQTHHGQNKAAVTGSLGKSAWEPGVAVDPSPVASATHTTHQMIQRIMWAEL